MFLKPCPALYKHPSQTEPLLAHCITIIGIPRATALKPKKKSNSPATAVYIAPISSVMRLQTGNAIAVTAHACFEFLFHLTKSPVIVLLTINVPTDAVKPSANVHSCPTTGETHGFPPVSEAITVNMEYIIHTSKAATVKTAILPNQAIAFIPET